jgi:2-(1,2-epoxy-1,2-dihydrophenyl)acetyl-CoA isomerase
MTDDLLITIDNGIATLTMNRAQRKNAMSPAMVSALLEWLPKLAEDSSVGVVIITGAGNAFCSGGDVNAMAERTADTNNSDASLEQRARQLRKRMEIARWLHDMPQPTIAKIGGAAAGAGLSIALACDMRIACKSAKFTTAFGRVGYSGDFGGSYFLTRLVGTAKAREFYYTAAVLDADSALALGLLNRVVADEQLDETTQQLAQSIADGPRIALGYMKRNMNAAENGSLQELLDLEAWHHSRCALTEDHKEAARAFVEKRKPVFKGR